MDNSDLSKYLPLEKEAYTSQLYHRDEIIKVLRSGSQYLGSRAQLDLKQTGDFYTTVVFDEPVILVVDSENQVKAYSNVCRHRGAIIEPQERGNKRKFSCRYHGWSYNTSGILAGAPEFQDNHNFKKEDICLPHYAIIDWAGLIFIQMDKQSQKFAEFFDHLDSEHSKAAISQFHFHSRKTYELKCNWKVFIDNYLDGGLHINTVHPNLANVVDYGQYENLLYSCYSLQKAKLQGSEKAADVANVRKGEYAYYWWFFPNTMINIYAGTMDINTVIPVGENNCIVHFDYFFDPEDFSEEQISKSIEVGDQIQWEDMEVCEAVQKGLHSDFYIPGPYSQRRESTMCHFHQMMRSLVPLETPNTPH